jgi:outer membrane biosynthesis protein TonB
MTHRALHIAVALATFASGLLLSGECADLATAVPLALLVFGLLTFSVTIDFGAYDLHTAKVWALTLVLWVPVLMLFAAVLAPLHGGSCVAEVIEDEPYSPQPAAPVSFAGTDLRAEEQPAERGVTVVSCNAHHTDMPEVEAVWVGLIDKKALSKPAPPEPPSAPGARGPRTVAVNVIVDETGRVIRAQALAGHPLLRHAAVRAACHARFAPTYVNGPPIRVSGVLTYRF